MASFPAFQSLIDTVQGGLLLLGPDKGDILAANQLAAIVLVTPHAQLIGQSIHRFLPADDTQVMPLLTGQDMVYNRNVSLQTATGRRIDVQLSLRKILIDDRSTLAISFSDRTEQQLMGQLLGFEQQLLARSLKLIHHLHPQPLSSTEDDLLTGVISMPQLLAAAHRETGRIRRYGGVLSGMLVQLSGLPETGAAQEMAASRRQLLRLAGSLCVQTTRDSDLVARMEEDMFLILLPDTTLDGAEGLASRLLQALGQHTSLPGTPAWPEVCIGISALRADEEAPNVLLARLQGALGQARMAGGNRIYRQA